ncbi:MAG: hypothetical protein OXC40_04925 [Proteobacteria bacterium]|nr:hypothetical protein [Pseudomonadota bacterium]
MLYCLSGHPGPHLSQKSIILRGILTFLLIIISLISCKVAVGPTTNANTMNTRTGPSETGYLNYLSSNKKKLVIAFTPIEDYYHRIIVTDVAYQKDLFQVGGPKGDSQSYFNTHFKGSQAIYSCHAHYTIEQTTSDPLKYCVPAWRGRDFILPKTQKVNFSLPVNAGKQSIFSRDDLPSPDLEQEVPARDTAKNNIPPVKQPSAEIIAAENEAFTENPSTVIMMNTDLPTDVLVLAKYSGQGTYNTKILYNPYPDSRDSQAWEFGASKEQRGEVYHMLKDISIGSFVSKDLLISGIINKIAQITTQLGITSTLGSKPVALVWGKERNSVVKMLASTHQSLPLGWYNVQPVKLILPLMGQMVTSIYHPTLQHYNNDSTGSQSLYQTSRAFSQLPGLYDETTQSHKIARRQQKAATWQWLDVQTHMEYWHFIHPRFHPRVKDGKVIGVRFRPTPKHSSDNLLKRQVGDYLVPISKDLLDENEQKCLGVAYINQLACQGKRP